MATHGWNDPLLGLLGAGLISVAAGFVSSFLVLRGSDLTRLMVTLGVALMLFELANKLTSITGGVDGLQGIEDEADLRPVLRPVRQDRLHLQRGRAIHPTLIARRIRNSPFGLTCGIRLNQRGACRRSVPRSMRLVGA